jgi:hypothetical protein
MLRALGEGFPEGEGLPILCSINHASAYARDFSLRVVLLLEGFELT